MTHVPGFAGYADRREFGLSIQRSSEGSSPEATIAVDVRVFSDYLVVEARPNSEWGHLEAFPVQLHRDHIERVELGKGRGLRRWSRFGVVHATFDFMDRRVFDLMVDRQRAP